MSTAIGTCGCTCGNGSVTSGTGTIKYIDLDGGFYGIVSDDGEEYESINLVRTFQEDGLRVRFEATILKDTNSIHMWGTPIKFTYIEKLKGG